MLSILNWHFHSKIFWITHCLPLWGQVDFEETGFHNWIWLTSPYSQAWSTVNVQNQYTRRLEVHFWLTFVEDIELHAFTFVFLILGSILHTQFILPSIILFIYLWFSSLIDYEGLKLGGDRQAMVNIWICLVIYKIPNTSQKN